MKFGKYLEGEKVRLVPFEADRDSKLFSKWRRNSEYLRLMDGDIAILYSAENIKKWMEENELADDLAIFIIKTIVDDQIVGEIGLFGFKGKHNNSFVGISIGEAENWGKGYGTDAMKIILQYGFGILNLNHISLTVFEYNQRGVRSYEKAGFKMEGTQRKFLNRDGRRWDMYRMGILKSEWEQLTQSK
ncbi:MAG TPA: GNAT family protein [Anaerolineaceae bacterium]|nr:GNAT family protein [Anaerolineaceae bacterium]